MSQVKQEQVRLLHRLSGPSLLLSYVVAMIMMAVFSSLLSHQFLAIWFGAITLITSIRASLLYLHFRGVFAVVHVDFWAKIYTLGTLLSGCCWGALALQLDSSWPAVQQLILFASLSGLIAGSIGSHSCYFPALVAFFAPILICQVAAAMTQTDPVYFWLVPLLIIFWIIVQTAGIRFSNVLKSSIQFQQSLTIANEKLELLSRLDSLTQLNNRGALEEYLNEIWPKYSESGMSVAIAMIDVDMFKSYNDTYGHVEGDRCLAHIARILQYSVPEELGFIGRYGGEEFIAVLPGHSGDDASILMSEALDGIRDANIRHRSSSVEKFVTVSVGIESAVPVSDDDWFELIDRADAKLYLAKQQGRNRIVS